MKVKDWADHAWDEFADLYLADKPNTSTLRLLKEAWLHGARHGIAEAQKLIAASGKNLSASSR